LAYAAASAFSIGEKLAILIGFLKANSVVLDSSSCMMAFALLKSYTRMGLSPPFSPKVYAAKAYVNQYFQYSVASRPIGSPE